MPQQGTFKKAEYKTQRDTQPFSAKRSEWYRCSEGLTVGNRMTGEGEILHISELDTDILDPATGQYHKGETFQPLSTLEQERRFGRIMYLPYDPSDEELADLGWERVGVIADDTASEEQLLEVHGEEFKREVGQMSEQRLRDEGAFRYGLNFPVGMPVERMRRILLKQYEQGGEDPDFVTEQMKANLAQRVPGQEAHTSEVTKLVDDAISEDREAEKEAVETKEAKAARRRARAQQKVAEAEDNNA